VFCKSIETLEKSTFSRFQKAKSIEKPDVTRGSEKSHFGEKKCFFGRNSGEKKSNVEEIFLYQNEKQGGFYMIENMKYYDEIRKRYPETISKSQFYQIAHISKATALYLLQSGLVPCRDTGKKTRRYTIRIDDVIFYMLDRELHPERYRAPPNWYRERSGRRVSCVAYKNELITV